MFELRHGILRSRGRDNGGALRSRLRAESTGAVFRGPARVQILHAQWGPVDTNVVHRSRVDRRGRPRVVFGVEERDQRHHEELRQGFRTQGHYGECDCAGRGQERHVCAGGVEVYPRRDGGVECGADRGGHGGALPVGQVCGAGGCGEGGSVPGGGGWRVGEW